MNEILADIVECYRSKLARLKELKADAEAEADAYEAAAETLRDAVSGKTPPNVRNRRTKSSDAEETANEIRQLTSDVGRLWKQLNDRGIEAP